MYQEIAILKKLDHVNVVKLIEVGGRGEWVGTRARGLWSILQCWGHLAQTQDPTEGTMCLWPPRAEPDVGWRLQAGFRGLSRLVWDVPRVSLRVMGYPIGRK